jgi:hypothetical protein
VVRHCDVQQLYAVLFGVSLVFGSVFGANRVVRGMFAIMRLRETRSNKFACAADSLLYFCTMINLSYSMIQWLRLRKAVTGPQLIKVRSVSKVLLTVSEESNSDYLRFVLIGSTARRCGRCVWMCL